MRSSASISAGEALARRGEVMAFLSCKGGSGATFLATNLGYAIAAIQKKRVLLIDLNLQFGDAALFVSDRRPAATLSDVVRDIDQIDAALVQSSVVEVLPNFGVLASPEDPTHAAEIRPEHVERLVRFTPYAGRCCDSGSGPNDRSSYVASLDLRGPYLSGHSADFAVFSGW